MKLLGVVTLCLASLLLPMYANAINESPQPLSTEQVLDVKNKNEGIVFLEANKKKPGIITLPSGLQYKILVQGNGKKPKDTDTVTVHYQGTLINGTEFDSSYKRGKPISFPLKNVIRGWTEALQLMPVGSTWEVYIPSELAYGEQGAPPVIGPNEVLIFKINLIDISK